MRALRAVMFSAFLLSLSGVVLAADSPMGQHEIEEGLTCQCGCGLTVASCNHLECSFAVPARKRIADSLARGESGEQILDDFKREYGEKVLSTPVPEGFNLMAWIGPYLGIFVAGALMFTFFRRRAGKVASVPETTAPATVTTADGEERRARLKSELEELDR